MGFNKIAEAFVEIKGDKGKFSATIRQGKRETSNFAKSATKSLKRVSIGLAAIATAATVAAVAIGVKLTRAIIRAGQATISAAVKYDKLNRGLVAVTGSVAEANKQLIRLRKVAELPGLSFEAAIRGSINLQAADLSAQMAERSLTAFGNAIVTMGGGVPELQRVNLQLAQMAARSSGFGEEIRTLRAIVPQIGPILRKAFDGKALEEVSITGKELLEVIVSGLEDIPKATGGVANALDNLKIEFDLLKAAIGKTMLGIVEDTANSLASVLKKIAAMIPEWGKYKDQVSKTFADLIPIVAKETASMMTSMMKIVLASARLIWEPIKFSFFTMMNSLTTEAALGFAKLLKKMGVGTEEGFQKAVAAVREADKEIQDNIEKTFEEGFTNAMKKALAALEVEGPKIASSWERMLAAIASAFDRIKIEEAIAETVKKTTAVLEAIDPAKLKFLIFEPDDPKKLDAVLKDSEKRIISFRDMIDKEMKDRQGRSLANFQEMLREQERAAQDFADAIRPAFENMFIDFFSGNTKNLWQNFFSDLKRIAIRELASIFAIQLLKGLLTGGTSLAATGLGASLSALAPQSIDPTSRAIGGAVSRGARAVGNFLEGGTIIVNDQDLSNFDVQRMTKQVEQGIGPALRQAAADGIQ
jgi:hypothetical protein